MKKWKEMSGLHKVATVVACIAALMFVVSKVWPELLPMDLTYPAIALFTVCEALIYWKEKRKWAWLLIAAAVVSLACFILERILLAG